MKKYLLIILIALLLTIPISVLIFSRSEKDLLSMLPFAKDLYTKSSLTISTDKGVASVNIDGEDMGETPLELTDMEPGSHTVTLTRDGGEGSDFYKSHTFFVDLQPNTEAIIDIEIGPNDNLSGYVLFYTPTPSSREEGFFTINGNPEEALLNIDGKFYAALPISAESIKPGDYNFEIEKEGYESTDFPVIIREGLNLNITTYLMPIPIKLDTN